MVLLFSRKTYFFKEKVVGNPQNSTALVSGNPDAAKTFFIIWFLRRPEVCLENDLKFFSNKIDIDLSFIRNIKENSLIASADTITIAADVTEEAIIEKSIRFFAANKIICNRAIKGCVQARACVANKIISE